MVRSIFGRASALPHEAPFRVPTLVEQAHPRPSFNFRARPYVAE